MCVWVYIYICDYVCVYVYIYMHEKYLHSLLDEMSVQKLNSSRFVTVYWTLNHFFTKLNILMTEKTGRISYIVAIGTLE